MAINAIINNTASFITYFTCPAGPCPSIWFFFFFFFCYAGFQKKKIPRKKKKELKKKKKKKKKIMSSEEGVEDKKEVKTVNGLTLEERVELAASVGEEVIQLEELKTLLANHPNPIAYDGFEPFRMHIAQGVLKAYVNKLTKCGVKFVFW